MNNKVPYQRLMFFKEQIGLDQLMLDTLHKHAQLFTARGRDFAAFFQDTFSKIEQTSPYLEVQDYPGQLQQVWMNWFKNLFSSEIDHRFLDRMWRSGQTHVRINLDHRFVNLGYCLARSFCRDVVQKDVPGPERAAVLEAVEKIFDLCLLIETDAFITSSSQCDSEVIKGITHQIRNPVMVIGASMIRLMRRQGVTHENASETFETVLAESRRMEKMVTDVSVYNEVFHSASKWSGILLHECLEKVVSRCQQAYQVSGLDLQAGFAQKDIKVLGHPDEILLLFQHLLENAFEALDPARPVISIQTSRDPGTSRFVLVEIFNTGRLASAGDTQNLFTPFYSTRAMGTGMGLPIARAVVQKIKGRVSLASVPDGVVCMVTLPRADSS